MKDKTRLDQEIAQMKKKLEYTAQCHQYNFRHPRVLAVSQRLDELILTVMKQSAPTSNVVHLSNTP